MFGQELIHGIHIQRDWYLLDSNFDKSLHQLVENYERDFGNSPGIEVEKL